MLKNKWLVRSIYWFATVFKLGYFPFAPGTITSFIAAFVFWFLPFSTQTLFLLIALLFFLGITTSYYMRILEQKEDPRIVVIDEWVGMWLALMVTRYISVSYFCMFLWYGVVFLLFRWFDIVKPFPIKFCETFTGGVGIMLDDIMAALYTIFFVLFASYFLL